MNEKMKKLFPVAVGLVAVAAFLSGCADIEIPSEDPFFKVGHTYETSEEHILIYRIGSFIWDDYEKWAVLEPIQEDEPDVRKILPELRKQGALKFDGHSQFYRGIFIYVPAGTKFRVDKTYYCFLESLECGRGLTYDITLLGDLAKHKHVYFVDYKMVRAKDITAMPMQNARSDIMLRKDNSGAWKNEA